MPTTIINNLGPEIYYGLDQIQDEEPYEYFENEATTPELISEDSDKESNEIIEIPEPNNNFDEWEEIPKELENDNWGSTPEETNNMNPEPCWIDPITDEINNIIEEAQEVCEEDFGKEILRQEKNQNQYCKCYAKTHLTEKQKARYHRRICQDGRKKFSSSEN
ncbi:616_t:CDS:2 [Entrophospora sp. SA101]|nr:616_t:CDS:2 [Entrophospora sp. SA101]